MAIIRRGSQTENDLRKVLEFDDEIPFVPAYDLLLEKENRLSDAEIAGIAIALFNSAESENNDYNKNWQINSRIESVTRR